MIRSNSSFHRPLSTLLLGSFPSILQPELSFSFSLRAIDCSNMQQGGGSESEVTWKDQKNINKFSRLNNRFHELEDEMKFLQEANDNLEDASNELILSDEEVTRFQIGEIFTHVPTEEVEGMLQEMKEENLEKVEKLKDERLSIVAKMAELKRVLYGKFKDSINLEED